jgi:ankyrin repeat protein
MADGEKVSGLEWGKSIFRWMTRKAVDEKGMTKLHRAAEKGDVEMMESLTIRGFNVNDAAQNGFTPLHFAAHEGHVLAMAWLVNQGADAKGADFGRTPLHVAAERGHTAVMEWLAEKGASILLADRYGQTPLHWAANNGHIDAMEWLAGKGADVGVVGMNGATPLNLAAMNGHVHAVEWLVKKGASLSTQRTENGRTPLHLAAQQKQLEMMKWLVGRGADVSATDERDYTPLHCAARKGHVESMEWLVAKGASSAAASKSGWTALHLAAHEGHVGAVEWLAKRLKKNSKARHAFSSSPVNYKPTPEADALINELLLPIKEGTSRKLQQAKQYVEHANRGQQVPPSPKRPSLDEKDYVFLAVCFILGLLCASQGENGVYMGLKALMDHAPPKEERHWIERALVQGLVAAFGVAMVLAVFFGLWYFFPAEQELTEHIMTDVLESNRMLSQLDGNECPDRKGPDRKGPDRKGPDRKSPSRPAKARRKGKAVVAKPFS